MANQYTTSAPTDKDTKLSTIVVNGLLVIHGER